MAVARGSVPGAGVRSEGAVTGGGGVVVKTMYDENRVEWRLHPASSRIPPAGWARRIRVSDVNRPGLALAGYFGYFASERVQVFGKTELMYLKTLSRGRLRSILERIFDYEVPCVIVTRKLPIPSILLQCAVKTGTPVVRTPVMTTRFVSMLTTYLEDRLAPSTTVHGTLIDVYGIGVLIMGKSGIGKSECALSLVKRGHRFVADDAVRIRRTAEKVLSGTHDAHLGFRMELRGIGIIDIRDLFGATSVRHDKDVQLVTVLEEWRSGTPYDRLGLEEHRETMLDVEIPRVVIPVRPGRDIALVVEVAASNARAKQMGTFHARAFDERMRQVLRQP